MQPKATTRRNDWAQLGMGAGALLLPPLALGAAFYSMLAPPEEDVARPAAAQAAAPQPATSVPPAGKSTGEATQLPGNPVQGAAVPAAPVQPVPTPAAATFQPAPVIQPAPAQITVTTAAAGNPGYAEGSTMPPAAESPPAALKRPVHRHARPQQDSFSLKNWLQQLGIMPRNNAKDSNTKDSRG